MAHKTSRRDFIRLAAASGVAAGVAPAAWGAPEKERLQPRPARPIPPSDTIQIATIGMGIIGFIDTETALRVPGTRFVAAADVYDSRLARTREVFGQEVATTRDYREILSRSDVDAVIIATPDHWHEQMAVEAMQAGKDVYLEKPMVQKVEEGPRVIDAQEKTGRILIVGSQFASSLVYDKVKELIADGAIGELNMIEAKYNRNSSIGAWQYSIAPDASPQTIDWDRFLGDAPQRPFDPVRFFRWRNYWDYGTAMAGDLYVHLLTSIHYALDAVGPTKVVATGGLRFWEDGREVPDVMLALLEYPETANHPSFTLSLQTNFADGGGGGSVFRFVGNEGVITAGGSGLTLERNPVRRPSEEAVVRGYNSVRTFSEATQQEFVQRYRQQYPTPEPAEMGQKMEFTLPDGYDDRFDHFTNFFDAVRGGKPVVEDAVFGYRAAAPTLLCNESYKAGRIFEWDPDAMKVVS